MLLLRASALPHAVAGRICCKEEELNGKIKQSMR
jgi:hypothetical protein